MLSLPTSTKGSGTWTIPQLRFVPAPGFTGSVEILYTFCDSTAKTLPRGQVSATVWRMEEQRK